MSKTKQFVFKTLHSMTFCIRSTFETGHNSFLIYLHILLRRHVLQTIYNTRTCRATNVIGSFSGQFSWIYMVFKRAYQSFIFYGRKYNKCLKSRKLIPLLFTENNCFDLGIETDVHNGQTYELSSDCKKCERHLKKFWNVLLKTYP